MKTLVACRGCRMPVPPTARLCYVCRCPEPTCHLDPDTPDPADPPAPAADAPAVSYWRWVVSWPARAARTLRKAS
jgi:hypothetical protein